MKALFLGTGNELLNGDIQDTNAAWLHNESEKIGLDIYKKVIVGDDVSALVSAIRHAAEQ